MWLDNDMSNSDTNTSNLIGKTVQYGKTGTFKVISHDYTGWHECEPIKVTSTLRKSMANKGITTYRIYITEADVVA